MKISSVNGEAAIAAPIERVRRITGYLVGTLERWGDSKKAEERDRVKHNFGDCKNEGER